MKLRIRISLDIPDGQIPAEASPALLKSLYGATIGRAVASAMPADITVDTATVTRINIADAAAPASEE